jgi:FixJ family two-component response regulator
MTVAPTVFVVEDDPLVRGSLEALLRSAAFDTVTFQSGVELLAEPLPDTVSCLVVDVRLPMGSGLDLHDELKARGQEIPVIFMTGFGDVPMSVRAMKAGAVDFLPKPFRDQDMLDAVSSALGRDRSRREALAAVEALQARYDALTKREREVFGMVASGLLNKQIAGRLGVSEITVKLHRGNLMRKMQARTLAHLIRLAGALERARVVPTEADPFG